MKNSNANVKNAYKYYESAKKDIGDKTDYLLNQAKGGFDTAYNKAYDFSGDTTKKFMNDASTSANKAKKHAQDVLD